MNDAVITLKTESELKEKAIKLADELGFSLSSLINAYLKNLVRTKSVSYTLQPEGEPTGFMINGLKESARDIKSGRVSSTFTDAKSAVEWLKSD